MPPVARMTTGCRPKACGAERRAWVRTLRSVPAGTSAYVAATPGSMYFANGRRLVLAAGYQSCAISSRERA